MQYQALASLAYEVGDFVGDSSATFLTKCKRYLNNRYDDVMLRSGATVWSGASTAALGDSEMPTLGMGKVIREGATADAFYFKRQFQKGNVFEQKYEFALANYIISGDQNTLNLSFARYESYA